MARKALLIGTSQYLDGFKPLKSATHDVSALAKLLNNPEIGRFDEVQVETDLESSILAEKIETWYLGHGKDDFVLLFLVGHGVKDADRKLHFAATNTKKVREKLITTTAIAASDVSRWMGGSKAKRQIVILNCCFSGAFGDLVPMDEGVIDVDEAIWVEGRVVMTSTSSMDYAFERLIGGELSVYGHYLEEGLRTGAAAAADSDEITIDRLHQYVSRKVQEEAPSMVPKIFAKGEGYQLRIAKVALGDPTIQYRKEVDRLVQMFGEPIGGIARFKLNLLREKLNLNDFQVSEIEDQVLEPIRQRKEKITQYRNIFTLTVQESYPFDEQHFQILSEIKQLMGFLDEDVSVVEAEVLAAVQPELRPKESLTVEFDRLEDLLQKQQWKEANDETMRLLLYLADRQTEDWLLVGNIRNFSQDDLNTIDALWSNASQGRFGFGIQARIFEQSIGCLDISKSEAWQFFDNLVEWRNDDKNYYRFSLDAPKGHLPQWRKLIAGWGVSDRGISFLKRGLDCPLNLVCLNDLSELNLYDCDYQSSSLYAEEENISVTNELANLPMAEESPDHLEFNPDLDDSALGDISDQDCSEPNILSDFNDPLISSNTEEEPIIDPLTHSKLTEYSPYQPILIMGDTYISRPYPSFDTRNSKLPYFSWDLRGLSTNMDLKDVSNFEVSSSEDSGHVFDSPVELHLPDLETIVASENVSNVTSQSLQTSTNTLSGWTTDFQQLYQQAEKAYMQGHYDVAARIVDYLVDQRPQDPRPLLLRGHIYCYGLQRYDVAIAQYQLVLCSTQEPEFLDYANSGLSYARQCLIESENRINYTNLCNLLNTRKWKEADQETRKLMLQIVNREDYLDSSSLKNFPYNHLYKIDNLWSTASDGHFGFITQRKIWQLEGSPLKSGKEWNRFCVKVGWKKKEDADYLHYTHLKFDCSSAPKGELPFYYLPVKLQVTGYSKNDLDMQSVSLFRIFAQRLLILSAA